jgi:nucleoside-diphosphate-sugar epimerase
VRVVVLGGTRFVGPHVVRLLVDAGEDVTIFHRGNTEVDLPASVRHVHDEFAHLGAHAEALSPDVVVDIVPSIDKGGHGVRWFRGIAGRAVVVTSCDVYRAFGRLWRTEPGPPDPTPLTEDSPLRSKRAGDAGPDVTYDNVEVERAVSSDPELPVSILRLPAVYGPRDGQRRLATYVKQFDAGPAEITLPAPLAGWHWSRGYVENVAAAIALAVRDDRAAGRVYNVAETIAYSEAEWAARVGAAMGWDGEIRIVPAEGESDLDFRQDYAVDSTRIRTELVYAEIVSPDEGLRRSIEWEREATSRTAS